MVDLVKSERNRMVGAIVIVSLLEVVFLGWLLDSHLLVLLLLFQVLPVLALTRLQGGLRE